jgi:serine/threonine protein kinase
VGTLEYMAPEVLAMPSPADLAQHLAMSGVAEGELPAYTDAADLWALGCVLYEAISGCQPFMGESPEEMVHLQHCCLDRGAGAGLGQGPSAARRRSHVLHMELDDAAAEADLAAAVAQALGGAEAAASLMSGASAALLQPQPQPQPQPLPQRLAVSLHTGEALPKHEPLPMDNIGNAVVGGQFLLKHTRGVEQRIAAAAEQQGQGQGQAQQQPKQQHKVEQEQVRGFDRFTTAPDIFARHMFSPAAAAFLRRLLAWEPSHRASPAELLQHPWVTEALAQRGAPRASVQLGRSTPTTPRATAAVVAAGLQPPDTDALLAHRRSLRRSQTWDAPFVPAAAAKRPLA